MTIAHHVSIRISENRKKAQGPTTKRYNGNLLFLFCNYLNLMNILYFREEEAIKLDGLSVAQMKELRDKAEKHAFQAEVNRMMKLIINSLYRNKEVRIIFYSLCV